MEKIFSVIIPCYKNSDLLIDCIDSVLMQSYPAIEIIVCEDCGGDFDIDFYSSYIENNNTGNIISQKVYSNPENYGTVKNLNIALHKVHGEYIKIIAADDVLASVDSLDKVAKKYVEIEEECMLCDVLLCDNELNPSYLANSDFLKDMSDLSPEECFKRLCIRNRINAVGIFFKRSFFERNGLFDEKYRLLEDWPTWLRLYSRGDKIYYFRNVAVKRRMAVGVVANNNPYFLADRKLVWSDIIKPNKKMIGTILYVKSYISAYIFSLPFLRKIYYKIKKGDAQ